MKYAVTKCVKNFIAGIQMCNFLQHRVKIYYLYSFFIAFDNTQCLQNGDKARNSMSNIIN